MTEKEVRARGQRERRPRRDWADLSDGPAGQIAERVLAGDVADYVRLRAVCLAWRRCCADPRAHGVLDSRSRLQFHPRHWIMLHEKLAPPHRRRFLNLTTGECVKADLPELLDHRTLAQTSEGLLVLLHELTHLRLLNPLTRQLTDLLVLPPNEHSRLSNGDLDPNHLTAWGSGATSDSFVLSFCLNGFRIIGIARPGDERWTVVRYRNVVGIAPLMFSGRLYCVTETDLMVLELETTRAESDHRPPRMTVAASAKLPRRVCRMAGTTAHLVDNGGELMVMHRMRSYEYNVYRLDLEKKKLILAKTLSERALFLGLNYSFSVSTRAFPSICSDAVYFSFDLRERFDYLIEAYCLADRSSRPNNWILDISLLPSLLVPSPHSVVDCLSLCSTFKLYSSASLDLYYGV